MSKLNLTLAIGRYHHVDDLTSGRVNPIGIDINYLDLHPNEVFHRFIKYREFDLAEMSMAKYVSMISQGDNSVTALPVFPSRVARHASIYVRRDGPVKAPADLAGRRVGIPEWAQTACVYARGLLMHDYGVDLSSIDWLQAGLNDVGRGELVGLNLPNGIRLTGNTERTLQDLLLRGEVDAIITAAAPSLFVSGHPNIKQMFDPVFEVEQDYVHRTKILPIMHTVVMRSEILERHPWAAGNLFTAFDKAKNNSVARLLQTGAPGVPMAWCFEFMRQSRAIWGNGDIWPYGLDANRPTLELFLQYAYEQGVCHRLVKPDELFPKQLESRYKT